MCYNAIGRVHFGSVIKLAHKTVICVCMYSKRCVKEKLCNSKYFVLTQQLELRSLCNAKLALITLVC